MFSVRVVLQALLPISWRSCGRRWRWRWLFGLGSIQRHRGGAACGTVVCFRLYQAKLVAACHRRNHVPVVVSLSQQWPAVDKRMIIRQPVVAVKMWWRRRCYLCLCSVPDSSSMTGAPCGSCRFGAVASKRVFPGHVLSSRCLRNIKFSS